MLDQFKGELFLVFESHVGAFSFEFLRSLDQSGHGSSEFRILEDVDAASKGDPVTMVKNSGTLLWGQMLTVDEGGVSSF